MYNTYDDAAVNAVAGAVGVFYVVWLLICLAIAVLSIVSLWKILEKAGKPGWGALIPYYNYYLLYQISFGNGWLFLLLLVPCVNIVFAIMQSFKLATAFGKDVAYGFGILFLPIIFLPMLAFGDSEYVGPQ